MAAIIEIVASLVGPAIDVGKYIARPIKRQFDYLCCFNNNIQTLRDEAQKLKDATDGLQMKVDDAQTKAQVIFPEVVTWLETTACYNKNIINGIENDILFVQKGRYLNNMISRYSLSRKAKKTAEALRGLRDGCRFEQISQDAPPPAAMGTLHVGPMKEFESRKQIEENIMDALRDKNVNVIGICGMGGVGKTTMANRIMNRVREENLFDEIFMIVVSQEVDTPKIQRDIAESLGVDLGSVESWPARAHKIRTRLTGTTKRVFMVLDDVWKRLKLEDLGINSEKNTSGRCKILLTSRDSHVFDEMDTQKVFGMQVLPDREAWFLFREKTGDCVDRTDLHSVAQNVAKKCKGLPVALVTVGGALKNKTSGQVWEDALVQLTRSNPVDIPGVFTDLYKPLKLSYDYLESQHAKSLFLLCSMFKEDSNIHLDILTWYAVGLRVFEGIRNLNEARNRTRTLVEMLKSRFLLLEGVDEDNVRMHDVVRDMAIYIFSEEQRSGFVINLDGNMLMDWPNRENNYKDCCWISMIFSNRTEFPDKLQFPSLRLLMMQIGESPNNALRLPDSFLDGTKAIRVLSLESVHIKTLQLKDLQVLCLYGCEILETIAVVGELSKLEILSCRNCDNMRALPAEIGRLNHLRLLEIINCRSLETIVPGVISSLVCLEELKLRDSFYGWEAKENSKGKRNTNAALVELESLTNLTCLEIEISDPNLVAEEICLPSKIAKYSIRIGDPDASLFYSPPRPMNTLCLLGFSSDTHMGNWIQTLLMRTEQIELAGDGLNKVNLLELDQNMKSLILCSCLTVKKLLNTTTSTGSSIRFGGFPLLESLVLYNLPYVEEIFDGPIPHAESKISFGNLTILDIYGCNRLLRLFPVSMARSLLQLEQLRVGECNLAKEIFYDDDRDDKILAKDGKSYLLHMVFPKLRTLKFVGLKCLTTLCRGVQSIEFPLLIDMYIEHSPQLTSLIVTPEAAHDDNSLHQIFNHKIIAASLKSLNLTNLKDNISSVWCEQIPMGSFSNLEELRIESLSGIKYLMSYSMAVNLVRLKELTVSFCSEMLQVINIADDQEEVVMAQQVCLFPRLVKLLVLCHPKLRSVFGQWKQYHAFELPSLEFVLIYDCPQMETFTDQGFLSTPKLEAVNIDDTDLKVKDLNEAVKQHFKTNEST